MWIQPRSPIVNPTLEPDINPTKEPDVKQTKEPHCQGRILDLSEGGQGFLGKKNSAAGENFFWLKRLKKSQN